MIGATGDPATPYQQAVTMAKQLESAVLVTYEGEGRVARGETPRPIFIVCCVLLKKLAPLYLPIRCF